jgi:hypothetical protein
MATSAEASCHFSSSSFSNNILTSLAFTPDSKSVSATRISLIASSSSFIIFFQPMLKTHNHLPCLDYYVWLCTVSIT